MIYLYSFLFCGIVCLLGELVLDNTKLTPGHITSLFVSLGALLSYFNIYPWFVENVGVALKALGYSNTEIKGVLKQLKIDDSVELKDAVKMALRILKKV